MKKRIVLFTFLMMLGGALAAENEGPTSASINKYWRSGLRNQVLLQSGNGSYKLIFGRNGDLYILKVNKKVWSAGTTGKRAALVWFNPMSGNLEVTKSNRRRIIWSTYRDKRRMKRAHTLKINNYGMLMALDARRQVVWSIDSNNGRANYCSPRLR